MYKIVGFLLQLIHWSVRSRRSKKPLVDEHPLLFLAFRSDSYQENKNIVGSWMLPKVTYKTENVSLVHTFKVYLVYTLCKKDRRNDHYLLIQSSNPVFGYDKLYCQDIILPPWPKYKQRCSFLSILSKLQMFRVSLLQKRTNGGKNNDTFNKNIKFEDVQSQKTHTKSYIGNLLNVWHTHIYIYLSIYCQNQMGGIKSLV